jgi:hypothetical protein
MIDMSSTATTSLENDLSQMAIVDANKSSLYKPINIDNLEIRLVTIQPHDQCVNCQHGHPSSDPLIHCSMETFSLLDFTPESRKFIEEEEIELYSGIAFWQQNRKRPSAPEKHKNIPKDTRKETTSAYSAFTAESAFFDPSLAGTSWNRWTWGDFATLSYTWGDPNITKDIVLNGCIVKVTENLEAFLRLWSKYAGLGKDNNLKMWIDALCINQGNIHERNLHVKSMCVIYMCAIVNRAWVGSEADESNLAMSVLEEIGNVRGNQFEHEFREMQAALRVDDYFEPGSWKALAALLRRPFWLRLWIVQETAISAHNRYIICGDKAINWWNLVQAIMILASDLSNASTKLFQDYENLGVVVRHSSDVSLSDQVGRIQLLSRLCYHLSTPLHGPDLNELIYITRMSEQSEDRDKIYGILAMLDMKESGVSITGRIKVSYEQDVFGIFVDFTSAVIEGTGSLDIICTARSQTLGDKSTSSWIPDYRTRPDINMEMTSKDPYNAAKDTQFTGRIDRSVNPPRLVAKGLRFDIIDGLASVSGHSNLVELSRTISQSVGTDIMYTSDEQTKDAIFQAMVAGRDGLGNPAPETYETVVQMIALADIIVDTDEISNNVFFKLWFQTLLATRELKLGGRELGLWLRAFSEGHTAAFEFPDNNTIIEAITRAWSVTIDRPFMTTQAGAFGLASQYAQPGDVICLLLGCTYPVILRPDGDSGEFRLVGEAFIHGVMEGELLAQGIDDVEEFIIF